MKHTTSDITRKIIRKFRSIFFPTEQDKEYSKWLADGADDRFRYDYDLDKDSLVIDLGGYKGQWASDIYSRYNCRLLVIEPVEPFANNIRKRFLKNDSIGVHCLALGKNQRQESIALGDDSSSIYKKSKSNVKIQFEDVAHFFVKHNIENVDLMKVNIEGGEYELLPRLIETGLISKIKHLQIQFHNVSTDSEKQMEMICIDLSRTHRPTYQYKFVWENWQRRDV